MMKEMIYFLRGWDEFQKQQSYYKKNITAISKKSITAIVIVFFVCMSAVALKAMEDNRVSFKVLLPVDSAQLSDSNALSTVYCNQLPYFFLNNSLLVQQSAEHKEPIVVLDQPLSYYIISQWGADKRFKENMKRAVICKLAVNAIPLSYFKEVRNKDLQGKEYHLFSLGTVSKKFELHFYRQAEPSFISHLTVAALFILLLCYDLF